MKNALYLKGLRLWVQGLLLLALRWAQLKNGFDPETGLSRQSVPGIVLAAAILLLAAAEAAFCFRLPGSTPRSSRWVSIRPLSFSNGIWSFLSVIQFLLLPGPHPRDVYPAILCRRAS